MIFQFHIEVSTGINNQLSMSSWSMSYQVSAAFSSEDPTGVLSLKRQDLKKFPKNPKIAESGSLFCSFPSTVVTHSWVTGSH